MLTIIGNQNQANGWITDFWDKTFGKKQGKKVKYKEWGKNIESEKEGN